VCLSNVLVPLTGHPIHGSCLCHFALLTVSQPLSLMQDDDRFYLTTHRASHEWSNTITLLSILSLFVLRHIFFFSFLCFLVLLSLSTDHPTITSCSNHIISPYFLLPNLKYDATTAVGCGGYSGRYVPLSVTVSAFVA
jgi:hypothetical protein